MKTKYNIGDHVLIEAVVEQITVRDSGIFYRDDAKRIGFVCKVAVVRLLRRCRERGLGVFRPRRLVGPQSVL